MLVLGPEESNLRRLVQAVIQLSQGRSNANGRITLRANEDTTEIVRRTINGAGGVHFTPRTASASAEYSNGIFRADVEPGRVTITHANNALADREFYFIVLGG